MNKPNAGPPPPLNDEKIVVNGKRYHQIQVHCIFYSVSSHKSQRDGSLIDRGANGGIAGDDVCIIEKSEKTCFKCYHSRTNLYEKDPLQCNRVL